MATTNNRVSIVTGGAKGIGLAIAERFAADGGSVVIADIDDKAGEKAEAALAARGAGAVRYVHCDVAEKLDVRNLVAETLDSFGTIDTLVNNAGIVHKADFLDLDEAGFDRVIRINLKGAFLCGQAVARQMVEQVTAGGRPGSIVNLSSINAVVAIPDQVAYCVSKGGVSQLTKVMAQSLAPHGIRVNAIGPGSIMTDMLRATVGEASARQRILSRTPLGRVGEPAEIAAIAAFLASDEASYVTGQTLFADGGRLGQNYALPAED